MLRNQSLHPSSGHDRMFRGDVGSHAGIGAQSRHRRRVRDHAAAGLGHLRQFVFEAEENAGDIDPHYFRLAVFGLLGKTSGGRKEARIVERNVEGARLRNCTRDKRLHLSC